MTTPRAALAAALDGHLPRMAFLSYGKDLSMDYLGQLMDRNRDIPLGLGA